MHSLLSKVTLLGMLNGLISLHVGAAMAQGNGFSVSDYQPHSLNDNYKPGQGLIFKNSGSAFTAPSSSGSNFESRSGTRSAYSSGRAGSFAPAIPPRGQHGQSAYQRRMLAQPKISNQRSAYEVHHGLNKLSETNRSAAINSIVSHLKPAEIKPAEIKTSEQPSPVEAVKKIEPSRAIDAAPAALNVSSASATPVITPTHPAPPVVSNVESPATIEAPRPLTMPETILALISSLLYCIATYFVVRYLERIEMTPPDFADSIRPLHSVLLHRSPGPDAPPYEPGPLRPAYATSYAGSLTHPAKKSRAAVESNLAAFKTALAEKFRPEIIGDTRPLKKPIIAAALSILPGLGHLYNGQKTRGILLLVAAILINPITVVLTSLVGVEFLVGSCLNAHILIGQDVANLLIAFKEAQNTVWLSSTCLYLLLVAPASYDAYTYARSPKIIPPGELSLFDTAASAVLVALAGFVALFCIVVFCAPLSTTADLAKVTYVDIQLETKPSEHQDAQEATKSEQTSSKDEMASKSRLQSEINKPMPPSPAQQVGEPDPSAQSAAQAMDVAEYQDAEDQESLQLKNAAVGRLAIAKHMHRSVGDKVVHVGTTSSAAEPPTVSSKQQVGLDRPKFLTPAQMENQRLLDLPAVKSLPQSVSQSEAEKAISDAQAAMKKLQWEQALSAAEAAVKADGRSVTAYRLRALIEEKLCYDKDALSDSSKALALERNDREMYLLRARILKDWGNDYSGAVVSSNQALAIDPSMDEAIAVRGESRIAMGDMTGAQQDMYAALKLNPRSSSGYVLRSDIRAYFGDVSGAKKDAKIATDLNSDYARAWRALAKYTLNIKHLDGRGDTDGTESIKYVHKAQSLEPGDPVTKLLYGESCLSQVLNKPGSDSAAVTAMAQDWFSKSLHSLISADCYYQRALAYTITGDNWHAAMDWDDLRTIEPNTTRMPPQASVRQIFNTESKDRADIDKLNKQIAASPRDKELFAIRGENYLELKDYEKAGADFDAAIAIDPNYAVAHCQKAACDRGLNKLDEARKEATEYIRCELDPKYTTNKIGRAYQYRADIWLEMKEYGAALCDYVEVLKRDKPSMDVQRCVGLYTSLGWTYFNLGDYDQASICAKTVLALEPANAFGLCNLGEAEYKKAQYDKAESHLKQALEQFTKLDLKDNYGEAYYYIGMVHDALKQHDLAVAELAKAKEAHFIPEKGTE